MTTTEPPPELVTLPEIGRRVVAAGWAHTMSRQRVAQLADKDPNWPIPRDQWTRAGNYWLVPWTSELQAYFKARGTTPGPKGWNRDQTPEADCG